MDLATFAIDKLIHNVKELPMWSQTIEAAIKGSELESYNVYTIIDYLIKSKLLIEYPMPDLKVSDGRKKRRKYYVFSNPKHVILWRKIHLTE